MKNQSLPLQLVPCTHQNLMAVFRWFNSEKSVLYWAGPEITYPLQIKRFKTESKFAKSHSYVLKQGQTVMAFGQFYNRLGHCHLGRLVVSPKHRGQGVILKLIDALIKEGERLLDLNSAGLSQASLFVLADNKKAIKAYKKSGFTEAAYPAELPFNNCLYMVQGLLKVEKPD